MQGTIKKIYNDQKTIKKCVWKRRMEACRHILNFHNQILARSLTKWWKTEKPILWQIHWRSHEWRSEANLNSWDFEFGRKFIDDVACLRYWRPDANLISWDLEFECHFIDEVANHVSISYHRHYRWWTSGLGWSSLAKSPMKKLGSSKVIHCRICNVIQLKNPAVSP